jgi:DNA-binding response OmpR family regulator
MSEQASILLIEDETRLRDNLQVLLEAEGYRVISAENGEDGIQKLQVEPFDLVITDVVMPQVDGFQVMEYLKDHCPDVVVVAMTAYVSTESAIEALRRGAYDYLAKPFDVDLMQFVIKRALERARMQKAFRHYLGRLERKVEEQMQQLADADIQVEKFMGKLKIAQEQLLRTEHFRILGEVTATAAHKLGDALATIVGFAQFLARMSPPTSGLKLQLEQIGDMAFRCHELVQNLQAFAWQPMRDRTPTNLNDLCEQVLAQLCLQHDLSHIEIVRRFDPHLPTIMVAAPQLIQACTTLALHACQMAFDSGQRARFVIETVQAQPMIRLIFRVEMPPQSSGAPSGRLMPFATSRQGLNEFGLRLAYETIKDHEGRVSLQTTPGEGAIYLVELPRRSAADSRKAPPPESHDAVGRKHVLVVDADEKTLTLLREIVHHLGCKSTGSTSAEQALQAVAAADYDLIITDMFLPTMDATDFHHRLRTLRPDLAQRVLFISDGIVSDQMRTFLEQIDGYLIKKPFSVADIEMGMRSTWGPDHRAIAGL